MSERQILAFAVVGALMVTAACGGSSGTTEGSSPGTASAAQTAAAETTETNVPGATAAPTTEAPGVETTTSVPPTTLRELADLESFTTITVTTPAAGNGEHPLLSWDPVDGAAEYLLVLTRADGEPYWAWSGTEPQIWLGGSVDEPAPNNAGPYLAEPMTLRVMAVGADGAVFAASHPVEVAP